MTEKETFVQDKMCGLQTKIIITRLDFVRELFHKCLPVS